MKGTYSFKLSGTSIHFKSAALYVCGLFILYLLFGVSKSTVILLKQMKANKNSFSKKLIEKTEHIKSLKILFFMDPLSLYLQ